MNQMMIQDKIEIEIEKCENIDDFPLPSINSIDEVNVKDLSYNDFFSRYMVKNLPIVITGIADRWECMNWVKHDSGSFHINFDYLQERIDAELKVPIAHCDKVYFNSHEKSEMMFSEFLIYWKQNVENKDENDLLYLKDWHLRREQPDYKFYKTPPYFASDWLNEYCEMINGDDYRFVYMGPKGTWTPFHADVFSSFSWSTNIVGTKKWIFFPPKEEDKLRDSLDNLPFDIAEEKIQNLIREKCIQFFEINQKAGQTIFVPSGWHHQVWNLENTISVNHNWFNGCNIRQIWLALFESYNKVLHEIDDCKDMENFDEHCQLMLKSVFGLDFKMFFDILNCIVENRLNMLSLNKDFMLNEWRLGQNHAMFDLIAIRNVVEDIKIKCNHLTNVGEASQTILQKINEIIK